MMLPGNEFLGADRCFGDLLARRMPRVARKVEAIDVERIRRAEEGADVPQGANVMGEETEPIVRRGLMYKRWLYVSH